MKNPSTHRFPKTELPYEGGLFTVCFSFAKSGTHVYTGEWGEIIDYLKSSPTHHARFVGYANKLPCANMVFVVGRESDSFSFSSEYRRDNQTCTTLTKKTQKPTTVGAYPYQRYDREIVGCWRRLPNTYLCQFADIKVIISPQPGTHPTIIINGIEKPEHQLTRFERKGVKTYLRNLNRKR